MPFAGLALSNFTNEMIYNTPIDQSATTSGVTIPAMGVAMPIAAPFGQSTETGNGSLEMMGIEAADNPQEDTTGQVGQKDSIGYQTREGSEVSARSVYSNNDTM